jgi:chloramphenicol-sensitive protein RarD
MDRKIQGTISAAGSFFLWALFPVYWKALKHVPATQILAHRVVWSLVFVVCLIFAQRQWKYAKAIISESPNLSRLLVPPFLLAVNWLIYIWAVNTDQIVEASLGYFINPIVNVFLGMIFLRERLQRWQGVSVALAFTGVFLLAYRYGHVPWIAFSLAFTFGTYGLLRKTGTAGAKVGLLYETAVLTPLALAYLIYSGVQGAGAFGCVGLKTDLLLAGAGVVTAVPLILFAYGARRIQYSTVGFLQYLTPTGQLLLGVLLYKEPFTGIHAVSFGLVWTAIIIYSISSYTVYKRRPRA